MNPRLTTPLNVKNNHKTRATTIAGREFNQALAANNQARADMIALRPHLLRVLLAITPFSATAHSADPLFNRDIRPILSENCFSCHGPNLEHRGGKLRLDVRAEAVAARHGTAAIIPGDPDQSEIIRRILSHDPEEVMPPPKAHLPSLQRKSTP